VSIKCSPTVNMTSLDKSICQDSFIPDSSLDLVWTAVQEQALHLPPHEGTSELQLWHLSS